MGYCLDFSLCRWIAFLLLSSAAPLHHGDDVSRFYIGTVTDQSTSQGIYLGSIDTDTGKLGMLTLAAAAKNPNFLTLSTDNKLLFAALSSTVGSFQVESDGTLNPQHEQRAAFGRRVALPRLSR